MKDTLTSQNYQDFRQRYRGTYGLFPIEGKEPILVRLIEVDDTEVRFEDSRGGSYSAKANSGLNFEFFSVERKLFNTPEGVLYCRRKPARQWSRGVSSANTTITNLLNGRELSVGFKNIESLFNSKEQYSQYVKELLEGKRVSAAFNGRFACLEGSLMMFDTKIGTFAGNTATVDELYQQEFSDMVKRNNWEIIVK